MKKIFVILTSFLLTFSFSFGASSASYSDVSSKKLSTYPNSSFTSFLLTDGYEEHTSKGFSVIGVLPTNDIPSEYQQRHMNLFFDVIKGVNTEYVPYCDVNGSKIRFLLFNNSSFSVLFDSNGFTVTSTFAYMDFDIATNDWGFVTTGGRYGTADNTNSSLLFCDALISELNTERLSYLSPTFVNYYPEVGVVFITDNDVVTDPGDNGGFLGFLKQIIDWLLNFWNKFLEFIKSIFIPPDGYFESWFQEIKDKFEEKTGGLVSLINSISDMFKNLSSNISDTSVILKLPDNYLFNGFKGVSVDLLSSASALIAFIRNIFNATLILFTVVICYRKLIGIIRG